jgi:tryptophanyl-tRNA synthetase
MRPILELLRPSNAEGFLFIADGHALTSVHDGAAMRRMTKGVAAAWLAAFKAQTAIKTLPLFYRQSAVPQVFELFWILSCMCPKGLMNRAHAYKAVVQPRIEAAEDDIDRDVSMGLFNYPVLMAADILLFGGQRVPVGPDQLQHVEIARDLAQKFNQAFGDVLEVPEAVIPKDVPVLEGLDGRKMSKSYGNVIPLFCTEKELRALIFKIKTNSLRPEEPKDPQACSLFKLFQAFAAPEEVQRQRQRYETGIGWADVKEQTFAVVQRALAPLRGHYDALISDPSGIETQLLEGEARARGLAEKLMRRVRRRVGFAAAV